MEKLNNKRDYIIMSLIVIAGIIGLFSIIAVRSQSIFNIGVKEKLITGYWDNTKYGELYYFNYIKHFKEENLPQMGDKFQYSSKQASIEDADIILFGDSFFDICRPTQYPTELSKRLNKKVHFAYNDFPLQYLNMNHYKAGKPKLLILGIVERYIPIKLGFKHTSDYTVDSLTPMHATLRDIKDIIFAERGEELYDALLKRSYLSSGIYSEIATIKFDLFGYISNLTPKYSFKDTVPWIFYHDEVNGKITSFYYNHSDEEIEQICNNVADLAKQLKEQYNIDMIFIPIPAKYTICHSRINNDQYSNFLPKLEKKMDEKGIKYIDFYDTFMTAKDILYIPTDGHWNEKGLNLGVDLTIDYLKKEHYFEYNQESASVDWDTLKVL